MSLFAVWQVLPLRKQEPALSRWRPVLVESEGQGWTGSTECPGLPFGRACSQLCSQGLHYGRRQGAYGRHHGHEREHDRRHGPTSGGRAFCVERADHDLPFQFVACELTVAELRPKFQA